jgi:hypothetical protein
MIAGDDWIENLTISPTSENRQTKVKSTFATNKVQPVIPYQYHHKALPEH